ncbi:MAG: hypothetical protein KGH53_03030 [Candidatus Micrarchaeota archaeon]|nr:hypothetical protein [Candidatus Micrarchaeota archaeon]
MARFKLPKSQMLDAAILVLAAEFRQSKNILLDKELRKTRRGAAMLGSSVASGFMIGSSITTIGSQISSAFASKPVDLVYGDLVFAAGIAIQTAIHFIKRRLKQNA